MRPISIVHSLHKKFVNFGKWQATSAKACIVYHSMCTYGKQLHPMTCSFSQGMHAHTWNARLLQAMLANGMWHKPMPSWTHVEGNVGQDMQHYLRPACINFVVWTFVGWLQPWSEIIRSGLYTLEEQHWPTTGKISQVLHIWVVAYAHRLNDIGYGISASPRRYWPMEGEIREGL